MELSANNSWTTEILGFLMDHAFDTSDSVVYCIASEEIGAIKIGISSAPGARLKALQTASFATLSITCLLRGGKSLEGKLHKFFRRHCENRGEWFKRNAVLDEFLDLARGYDVRYKRHLPIPPDARDLNKLMEAVQ